MFFILVLGHWHGSASCLTVNKSRLSGPFLLMLAPVLTAVVGLEEVLHFLFKCRIITGLSCFVLGGFLSGGEGMGVRLRRQSM